MMSTLNKKTRGFTLIEILVVIGLIAILAAIVLIAINPARQFAQARNSQRESNVNTILNAVGQRLADNKGVWTTTATCDALPSTATNIDSASGIDLSCLVPTYIPSMLPFDPSTSGAHWTSGTDYDTKYTIVASSTTGRIEVCSGGYAEAALGITSPYCLSR